jgi:hypothetical protein
MSLEIYTVYINVFSYRIISIALKIKTSNVYNVIRLLSKTTKRMVIYLLTKTP